MLCKYLIWCNNALKFLKVVKNIKVMKFFQFVAVLKFNTKYHVALLKQACSGVQEYATWYTLRIHQMYSNCKNIMNNVHKIWFHIHKYP